MQSLPKTSTIIIFSVGFITLMSLFALQETTNPPTPALADQPAPITALDAPPIIPLAIASDQKNPQTMSTVGASVNIGISDNNRHAVAKLLNELLSDEFVVYTKTLNYHWNVYGPLFHMHHELFKTQYEQLFDIIDLIAERARALGQRAFGSLQEFKNNSTIKDQEESVPTANHMIANLLDDHHTLIKKMRVYLQKCADEYGDMGTSNFLTDLMERHEKIAWMLRVSLSEA